MFWALPDMVSDCVVAPHRAPQGGSRLGSDDGDVGRGRLTVVSHERPAGSLSHTLYTRNNNNSPCVLRTLSRLSFAKHSLAARTPARAHIQVSPRACALHAPRPSAGRTAHLVPVTSFAKHSLAARTPARAHIQALGFLARPPLAQIFCGPALSRPCDSWLVCVCPGIFPYVHVKDVTPYSTSFSEGAVP